MRRPALLDPPLAVRVSAVAADVAARVVDPQRIATGVATLGAHTAFPSILRWRPGSVALGDAGAAVVCAALDGVDPGVGWDRAGHAFLSSAVAALDDGDLPLSLFAGSVGVSAAATLLSRGGLRYAGLRASLDAHVLPAVTHAARDIRFADGLDESGYDLVAGLSGWAAGLLLRPDPDTARTALAEIGETLVGLGVEYPEPGLAHGAAGPLATLALLHLRAPGLVPGAEQAVRALGDRLSADRPTTRAWCSGTPGVARALWLAGAALHDSGLRKAALDLALDHSGSAHRTPTLCHGTAGALLATAHFWWDTADPAFRADAALLCERLLEAYQPDSLFGFRDVESTGIPVDNGGVLVGAAGVALTLLALDAPCPPAWTRLFLLS